MDTARKLYKSNSDKIIDGVCSGIAEYLHLDANLVRVGWIALILLGGSGIILYIAGIIVIPRNPSITAPPERSRDRAPLIAMTCILIGSLILLHNINLLDWFDWHISWRYLLPVLFIVIGAWLLLDYSDGKKYQTANGISPDSEQIGEQQSSVPPRILRRSVTDQKILGVCGGLASYFEIDSSVVRMTWVLLLFASFGLALILYFVLGIFLPREIPSHSPAQ